MRHRPALAALSLALVAVVAAPAPPAEARHGRFEGWARQSRATIRPGNWVETSEGSCTANFVFTDRHRNVYVGVAAHCFSLDGPTATNGCQASTRRPGARARVQGAGSSGVLVYSSWWSMQRRGERRPSPCRHNDFALVRLAGPDRRRVNPTVPVWGGPRGVARTARFGARVVGVSNSPLWLNQTVLRRKQGVVLDAYDGGWAFDVVSATPGVPGDSGAGLMHQGSKEALGVLVTIQAFPPGSNGVTSLRLALKYMKRSHEGLLDTVRLADAHR